MSMSMWMPMPMAMPMPTPTSSSPARCVAFDNLGSNGLMSDNTLWARTVCVWVCVRRSVSVGPSLFFFLEGGGVQLKVFRWQKLCGNLFCCVSKCPCGIYTFARVLTVCTSFSPVSRRVTAHTHTHALINTPTYHVNSAFVCCFFPAPMPSKITELATSFI